MGLTSSLKPQIIEFALVIWSYPWFRVFLCDLVSVLRSLSLDSSSNTLEGVFRLTSRPLIFKLKFQNQSGHVLVSFEAS